MELIVNTWRTKSTPWLVLIPTTPDTYVDALKFMTKERLKNIRDLIASLPARINTPKHYSILSLPRYYLIATNEEENNIIDIIGIKMKEHCRLCPTKWSYKLGYWHPTIQTLITKTLDKYLTST
jgi:hypothetical protein